MGRNGFITGGNNDYPIPWYDTTMNLHQITKYFSGRKAVIHPVMPLCPTIAYVRSMKIGRLSPFLIDANGNLLRQCV
jgi:hypothetical protein